MTTSLTYFNFEGSRGLECRLALALAGVPFEDKRVTGAAWQALKPTLPFGSLPVLEEDGRALAQANAIMVYVGRTHGLHPSDPWEAAQHEAIMGSVEDFREKVAVRSDMDDAAKQAHREAFASGWLVRWAETVSGAIAGPYLAGEAIQVADLKLFVILRSVFGGVYDHVPAESLDAWPKLRALYEAVDAHPAVRGWLSRT